MFRQLSVVGYMAANGLHQFICDEVSDINNLPTMTRGSLAEPFCSPCQAGSTAVVIDTQQEYMLNNANEWKYYKNLQFSD